VARLTDMGKALLVTLERVFPFQVRYGKYTALSMWCNEDLRRCTRSCTSQGLSNVWAGAVIPAYTDIYSAYTCIYCTNTDIY
jgi:hypothetical protein